MEEHEHRVLKGRVARLEYDLDAVGLVVSRLEKQVNSLVEQLKKLSLKDHQSSISTEGTFGRRKGKDRRRPLESYILRSGKDRRCGVPKSHAKELYDGWFGCGGEA